MFSLGHPVIHFAWTLAIALSALVGILATSIFLRRPVLFLAARRSQKLRAGLEPWIQGLLDGSVDYDAGLQKLREHPGCARRAVLDRLPSAGADSDAERVATLRRVAIDLGLVDLWRRQLTRAPQGWSIFSLIDPTLTLPERIPGLSFVTRSEAAQNLGLTHEQGSWPLLVKALDDRHLAVRSVAAQALGRIQAPASFPLLARKLHDSALGQGRRLAIRTLKMALAAFPLASASELVDMLRHPHRRVRFLAADLVAAMLIDAGSPHNSLPDPIAEIFLTALRFDSNPDVRARAADVIAHLDDVRSGPALLGLLEDDEWFVRLHATRALAEDRSSPLAALGRRLTDSNWRVREAATQALASQGPRGVRLLLAQFDSTADRYSREQVAEQIERAGLIPSLFAASGLAGAREETRFIEGMVRLGRTAALRVALQSAPDDKGSTSLTELRNQGEAEKELPRLSTASTPAYVAAARAFTLATPDPRERS